MVFARAALRRLPGQAVWRRCWLAAVLSLFATPVLSQPASDPRSGTARGQAVRSETQWLQAIQSAAQRMNYAGTVVYQQGQDVHASRVVHLFDGKVSRERIEPLDGRPREFIRQAEEVQCLMPDLRRVLIERRLTPDTFPAIATADPAEILQRYVVRLGEVERVAGFECQIIHIEPKDRLRYGYRLWVDRATGLLLRAQTLNEHNEVLEQMAFAEVRIGDGVDRGQLRPSWSTAGWRIERTDQRPVDLARLGWIIAPPDGFRRLREVMRSMWADAGERKTMQAVFTDGIASVSVFIEPAAADQPAEAAQVSGPTSAYARRIGESRVTVVGEVPPATVRALAQSVEFRAPR